jgi:hypothetical protein
MSEGFFQLELAVILLSAVPAHLLVHFIHGGIKKVKVNLHHAVGVPCRVPKISFPFLERCRLDSVLHIVRSIHHVLLNENCRGKHVTLGSDVSQAAACVTDQTGVIGTNESAAWSVGSGGTCGTAASTRGEQSGRIHLSSATVVTEWGTVVPTRFFTTIHMVDTERAPLDRDVEVSVVIVVSKHPVDLREDQFDVCLCCLVQLMCESHHAKVGTEVSVVIQSVITVDASQERGDSIDVRRFLNDLEE